MGQGLRTAGDCGELFAKSGMVAEPAEPRKPSQHLSYLMAIMANWKMTKGKVTLHNVYFIFAGHPTRRRAPFRSCFLQLLQSFLILRREHPSIVIAFQVSYSCAYA